MGVGGGGRRGIDRLVTFVNMKFIAAKTFGRRRRLSDRRREGERGEGNGRGDREEEREREGESGQRDGRRGWGRGSSTKTHKIIMYSESPRPLPLTAKTFPLSPLSELVK